MAEYKRSMRPLREFYGRTPAREFGPLALKAVRQRMVESGLCRGVVNQRVGRIKRVFKWAVSEELVPPGTFEALRAGAGLARGRTSAPDHAPVEPVPERHVASVLPRLLPPVRAMVELQRLTGMRPGEVCAIRECDLDTSGPVWLYRPGSDEGPLGRHKTAYRGRSRVIALGPRAQAVLKPFLTARGEAYLFSPARAMEDLWRRRREGRKAPARADVGYRRRTKPKRRPGHQYSVTSYAHAVAKACRKAGVPGWHPNQLRHSHATDVRRRYGLEGAQVSLGQARADVTQVYAERDLSLAERIAREVG
jgi:integrase